MVGLVAMALLCTQGAELLEAPVKWILVLFRCLVLLTPNLAQDAGSGFAAKEQLLWPDSPRSPPVGV